MTLDELAAELVERRAFFSMCFVEKTHKWQANLRIEGGSGWKCSTADTVEEAVAALFAPAPVIVPSIFSTEPIEDDLFA